LTGEEFRHHIDAGTEGAALNAKRNGKPELPRSVRTTAPKDYVELWINLARREWSSLVVVPADRDGSTADVAKALADIGQRLSFGPVTAITISSLEYGSALALADLQQHVERERLNRATQTVAAENARPAAEPAARAAEGAPGDGPAPAPTEAIVPRPAARLIISVPPVVTEPLGLTAADEADAVVLAVRMNHSQMGEVRRTIELLGRERITGCFLMR
jgi:hypothetical protein